MHILACKILLVMKLDLAPISSYHYSADGTFPTVHLSIPLTTLESLTCHPQVPWQTDRQDVPHPQQRVQGHLCIQRSTQRAGLQCDIHSCGEPMLGGKTRILK